MLSHILDIVNYFFLFLIAETIELTSKSSGSPKSVLPPVIEDKLNPEKGLKILERIQTRQSVSGLRHVLRSKEF